MSKFLEVSELASQANYQQELEAFQKIIDIVNECNTSRIQLAADMADDSQVMKTLIIRAEDARLLTNMSLMKRAYTDLYALNNILLASHSHRVHNHETLVMNLKEVNQMIQKASNLRVGKYKVKVMNDCRQAVKRNNLHHLPRIISQGYDQRDD